MLRALRSSFLLAVAVTLCGCIVVPYEASEGSVGPRTEVAATVPDSIVTGKTTRAEVLQSQGKPDGEGEGDDWFVYSSTFKNSGLGLFFCFAANYTVGCGDARRQVWDYRRLVLRFDAAGVVSAAYVNSASCVRWTGADRSPVPCLDLLGGDLRHEDALALIQKGKQVLATYEDVRWPADQDNDCTFYGHMAVAQDSLYFVAGPASPFNRRHGQVNPARCPEPDSVVVFDDADITDVAIVEGIGGHQAVKLSRQDGSHFTYQFLAPDEPSDSSFGRAIAIAGAIFHPDGGDAEDDKVDEATLAHATELAADIQKATGKAPDRFGGLSTPAEGGPRTYDHIRWCSGWDPPNMPIVERQIPCVQPKDGYLILTATGFMFQLADAGDGVAGLVAGQYADIRSVSIRDSGRWGSYSHWVVVETKDGQIDAFDPGDSDRKIEINSLMQSHLPKQP